MENVAQNLQTQVTAMHDRHLKSQIRHKINYLFFETEATVERARRLKSIQQKIPYKSKPIHILQVIKDNLEGTWIRNYDKNVKGNSEIQAKTAYNNDRYKYIEKKMMEQAIDMLNHDNFLKKHAKQTTNGILTKIEEIETIRIPSLEDGDYVAVKEVVVGGRKKSRRRRKKRTKKRRKSRRKSKGRKRRKSRR